jgi:ribosomal protein S18 acetylase RimI-like enzyme
MLSIREADRSAVAEIVRAHELSFPGFLMTRLGAAFLRVYYGTSLNYSGTVALIAKEDERTVGFVIGYVAPQGFYALLRRRQWRLAWAAMPRVMFSPSLLPRVLGNMRRMKEAAQPGAAAELRAELASVGVVPEASGKGVGKALVTCFVRRAAALEAEYAHLTTDATNNDKVNIFYTKLGFRCSRTFLAPGGRLMNEYVLPLKGRPANAQPEPSIG